MVDLESIWVPSTSTDSITLEICPDVASTVRQYVRFDLSPTKV